MHQVRCRQPHALPLRHLIILPLNPWNPFGLPTGANRNGMFLCFPDPHLVKCDHSHCWKLQCFQCLQARVNDYATVLLLIIISSIQPEPKRSSCSVPMTPLIISPHLLQLTEDGVVLEEHALATQQVSSALAIVHIPYNPQKLWYGAPI